LLSAFLSASFYLLVDFDFPFVRKGFIVKTLNTSCRIYQGAFLKNFSTSFLKFLPKRSKKFVFLFYSMVFLIYRFLFCFDLKQGFFFSGLEHTLVILNVLAE